MNNYNFEDLKEDNDRRSSKKTLFVSTCVCIALCIVAVVVWLFVLNKKEEKMIQQDIAGYEWMYSFPDSGFQAYPVDDSFLSVNNVIKSFNSNSKNFKEIKEGIIQPATIQTESIKGNDSVVFDEYVDAVSLTR